TLRGKYISIQSQIPIIARLTEFLLILKAVANVHEHGLAIRDIKPQNILIDDNGIPVLADFGLSMWADTPDEERKTQLSEMVGSQGYRPPEWHSKYPDPNHRPGDIWSLGRTLWAIMSGRNPPNNYETLGSNANHLSNYIDKSAANILQG